MCNKEHLVGYLYDELSSTDRATFEAHMGGCAECRQEVAELRHTREHLANWSPPEAGFNVAVVQASRAAAPLRQSRRWVSLVPQRALAAAAALIVIAGSAAVANLEVRYESDGSLIVRTGWSNGWTAADGSASTATERQPEVTTAARDTASEKLRAEMVALQQRLRQLEDSFQKSQAAEGTRLAGQVRPGISAPELRKILAESEERQRAEMAAYTARIWQDWSAARVNDWVRIQQTMGQAHTLTNRQLQQQNDSIRYMQTVLQNQK